MITNMINYEDLTSLLTTIKPINELGNFLLFPLSICFSPSLTTSSAIVPNEDLLVDCIID